MAIGKVFQYSVDLAELKIFFGAGENRLMIDTGVLDRDVVPLEQISEELRKNEIHIEVVLGKGPCAERVWGCDLTEGYVAENAHYTT